ncbi:aspartate/glutamate racemase family protein [Neptunomonas sp.]|uniref:aspartate/glutamate racemase family protein n=1 Tax=Neptunomonas sp. TaxID=1971898 RepID=UPI0025E11DBD|nr:aspartate/glutamate racemase family protein [Neptunomonas sp.]
MQTIGLLGGMSWESTVSYYQLINQGIKRELGGLHSAKIILNSVDFQAIEVCQARNNWQGAADILCKAALNVQAGGADFLLICTNTMHKVAGAIEAEIDIPLLHIADATAQSLVSQGVSRVALLGTQFTMEQDFYKGRLSDCYGLDVVIPTTADRAIIHDVIYNELCRGNVLEKSKQEYLRIINQMAVQDVDAVILGCTEIGLLIKQADTSIPLFDTTEIHAQAAVAYALTS